MATPLTDLLSEWMDEKTGLHRFLELNVVGTKPCDLGSVCRMLTIGIFWRHHAIVSPGIGQNIYETLKSNKVRREAARKCNIGFFYGDYEVNFTSNGEKTKLGNKKV